MLCVLVLRCWLIFLLDVFLVMLSNNFCLNGVSLLIVCLCDVEISCGDVNLCIDSLIDSVCLIVVGVIYLCVWCGVVKFMNVCSCVLGMVIEYMMLLYILLFCIVCRKLLSVVGFMYELLLCLWCLWCNCCRFYMIGMLYMCVLSVCGLML